MELLLALVWPAAIPRLFTPIVPLLIILLVKSIQSYFETEEKYSKYTTAFILTTLLGLYLATQFLIRLQFLVVIGNVILLIALIQ